MAGLFSTIKIILTNKLKEQVDVLHYNLTELTMTKLEKTINGDE